MRISVTSTLLASLAVARTPYWAPVDPPRPQYSVSVSYNPATSRLEGTETIRFRNTSSRPIGQIALQWFGDVLRPRVNGVLLQQTTDKVFDLTRDLPPGESLELNIEFGAAWKVNDSAVASFLSPRIWWGFGSVADYDVKINVPPGYAIAATGRLDPKTNTWRAGAARAFGLFVGKDYETADADAGDTRIRAVFPPAARPCAELLLKTAVDVINFYRREFGFYPHTSLSIIPGMDNPAGGYPVSTAMVVIHGQKRLAERPEAFWRWITAHEIGHQYWGEHVLAEGSSSLSWLMIGLGIHADREFRRARGITTVGALEANYVNGVKQGFDTTMDITDEQENAIKWDFNNVVIHGKSAAMLNALESVLGPPAFKQLYLRCLKDYAGRRLPWRDFQRAAETVAGEDLEWFFDQWVRSSQNLSYQIAGQECSPAQSSFNCVVRVERKGSMRMPVTVSARFEDGSEQRAVTSRFADVDALRFVSNSPLKEVILDPALAMAIPPAAPERELVSKVRDLPYTGNGDAALILLRQARELKLDDPPTWRKIGLLLYDSRYYREALDVFAQVERSDANSRFPALVWQGHILDLLGRRPEAIDRYEAALKAYGGGSWQHSQYNLTINKEWVQERLKTPFERR